MPMPMFTTAAVTLLICSLILTATAEIKTLKITADDRPIILFEKFGFTHSGHVNIAVSSVYVTSTFSVPRLGRLGFCLLSDESLIQVLSELQSNPFTCLLDSHFITSLFNFSDLSPPPLASAKKSLPVTLPNEYSVFFANCEPESQVTMNVHMELYNLDSDGVKDYLPAGLTQLPTVYFTTFLAYIVFLGFWGYMCLSSYQLGSGSVHRIHLLMAGSLIAKALNLICAAEDNRYVKWTGTPHGWDVLFYIFHFFSVVLLFTVIVLISTGRSFMKPFQQVKDKKVLPIVILLQLLANLAYLVIDKTGPYIEYWVTWNQVYLLADFLSCCAIVIFPIVWSIRSLRKTSKTDGKATKNPTKLRLFRQFYIVVVGYLFFTRIVVFVLKTIAAYKHQWVANAAEEITSFAFYLVMFCMFRPVEKNEYFALDEDEEEAAKLALRDEE